MDLIKKIKAKEAKIGVIGLGYVGLPLVIRFCEENFHVIGFDVDPRKVERLNRGQSYIKHIPSDRIKDLRTRGMFEATTDYSAIEGSGLHYHLRTYSVEEKQGAGPKLCEKYF